MRDEVNSERLRKILETHNNYDGIVIISACYSQAIGQVFLDAGIKYVITIHDQCKIRDEAAIEFSVIFYRNLFKGKSIAQAFEEGKNGVNAMQTRITTCCCVHNHQPKCIFTKQSKNHSDHTPHQDCLCDKNYNFSIHKIDCKWALDFKEKYNPTRVPTADEIESGIWFICCCPPPLLPHTEALKFNLLKQTLETSDRALFNGREMREINDFQFEIPLMPVDTDLKTI